MDVISAHQNQTAEGNNPVEGEPFNRSVSNDPAYAEAHDRRILIVDDEDYVREMLSDYLNEEYSCETASDANQALEMMAREPFALVLSDIQMPGLGGIELLRKILERYPGTAVIMISGIDRTQRVIDALRVGAFDYLLKPCEFDVLTLCVERALERRALLRNARRYKEALENQNLELARRKAELERLQTQITLNEKMASVGRLAAGIAHELNNPAGFIHSNIDLLKEYIERLTTCLLFFDQISLTPEAAAQIGKLKARIHYEDILNDLDSILSDCAMGAERIRDIVQNLRLFSRLDEGELKTIDLHEGLDSTVRLLSQYYRFGKIALVRDYGDLPPISCYAARLNQVWMNLLVNAAQALGAEGGEVRIKTRRDESKVFVSISDTGRGIPPEYLKNVFDPFFTTKPVGEGTGLGLSISHGIIEQHHGSIEVQSLAGQGTIFTVALPIDAHADLYLSKPVSNQGEVN